jgi:transposase
VIAVAAGQANDAPALLPLLAQLRVARPVGRPRTRPDRLRGDKAYSSRAIRAHLRERGIVAVIPQPSDQIGHRLRCGSRGGRPPGFDAADYRNRNVIERRFGHLKQWRGLATRYDKLATVYRAAAVLNAVIAWPGICQTRSSRSGSVPARPTAGWTSSGRSCEPTTGAGCGRAVGGSATGRVPFQVIGSSQSCRPGLTDPIPSGGQAWNSSQVLPSASVNG